MAQNDRRVALSPRETSTSAVAGRSVRQTMCLTLALLGLFVASVSCGPKPGSAGSTGTDPALTTNGTVEVFARLIEIPEGAIFKRDLYDYATVLKYEVVKVQREIGRASCRERV